jgi:hypothetical protein
MAILKRFPPKSPSAVKDPPAKRALRNSEHASAAVTFASPPGFQSGFRPRLPDLLKPA